MKHFTSCVFLGIQFRYYILHTEVQRAHRRKFESNGREIEPNFSETHKVRTGYLNSSYSKLAII